jgi:hypothetical protein
MAPTAATATTAIAPTAANGTITFRNTERQWTRIPPEHVFLFIFIS